MFYIVMGVSGSGKSTVGKLLSDRLYCQFYDADDFHPSSNIRKMNQGKPLTDSDRLPWLLELQKLITDTLDAEKTAVLACSALKENYRKIMAGNCSTKVIWIYLYGDYETIQNRLKERRNHFLDARLLCSQFETLEEPKNALVVEVSQNPQEIVERIMKQLS